MPQRSRSAMVMLACALAVPPTAPWTQPALAGTGTRTTATAGQTVAHAANTSCVRQGQANYPVGYYWKNVFGGTLGSGSVAVVTSPSLWGGQITPGGAFTLTLGHRTGQWPLLVRTYTTTWDLSSLLAHADVVSQSGAGTISGNTLSITSPGTKTDPAQKVINFRVKPGTIGQSMTVRPTGISSVIAAPGQLGGNTPATPIQIVDGQSISSTRAVDDTATTTQDTAVSVPVLTNDTGAAPTIGSVGKPGHGTATISGGTVVYTPDGGFSGTDTFTYTVNTACGTSTATVNVTVACNPTPIKLLNGSFEAPPVAGVWGAVPDASTNPSTGWRTTATNPVLEFWNSGPSGIPAADGQQFAELNAYEVSTLYQDVPTVPGTRLTWSFYHRGRYGTDVMRVLVGAPGSTTAQTPTGASSPDISDDNTAWRQYTGVYIVPPGQTTTRFALESVSAAGGNPMAGNFVDGMHFGTPPCPSPAATG